MRLIRSVILILMFLLNPTFWAAVAQENGNKTGIKTSDLVIVDSKPSGAIVELKGLYNFIGRTPFVVPYPIRGRYKIKSTKNGYESVTTNMNFIGEGGKNLLIRLSPKTRAKAALRSMLFPGWGQIYGDNKFRGIIISTAQLALGLKTLLANNDYKDAQDELDRALYDFDNNSSMFAFQEVQNKEKDAEKAYNFRNTMIILTASFWIYNVLDSIIFFSIKGSQIGFKSQPLIQNLDKKSLMLSWNIEL